MFKIVKVVNKLSFGQRLARKSLAIALAAALLSSAVIFVACDKTITPMGDPKLIFSDEFDGAAVNLDNWSVYGTDRLPENPGTIRRGGWWTPESVSVDDGNLVIRTTYDQQNNTFYTGGVYANELLTYGYYEARCKLPEASGMWAAFWIMCDKIHLENHDASIGGAEIDIFESPYYDWSSGTIQHAIHTGGYGNLHQGSTNTIWDAFSCPQDCTHSYQAWHTFAVDWQPSGYTFYVDGVMTWQTTDPYIISSQLHLDSNVSSVPSYMILSVEVGGEGGVPGNSPFMFGGHPVNSNKNRFDMSNFSVDFLIDYVKVWDRYPYAI